MSHDLLPFFKNLEGQMIEWLCSFINSDTPSGHKPAIDQFVQLMAGRLDAYGAEIEMVQTDDAGNHLLARFRPIQQTQEPVLVLGHTDTVWAMGESARRPAQVIDGRVHGPGAFDMRGGLTLALALAAYLSDHRSQLIRPVTILLNSDEEVGSHSSRVLIENEARSSGAVLVVEPCLPGGALKTFRKGVGRFTIQAKGVAAHAGIDYNKGVSAIQEIAHQVLELYKLNDAERGTSINVGTIRGGSRSNVISDQAEIEVDLRVSSITEGESMASRILGLQPKLKGSSLEVSGGINRPPLERNSMTLELFARAKGLAAEIGIELKEGSTGGASDGCFTAALGIPTLDGLGPDGAGPHALHEHVLIESLVPRAALLALLALRL
jgi:glutamate carboxypeptidase